MNRLMGLRLNLGGPIREGDLKKKKRFLAKVA